MARQLLALPDIQLVIEGFCDPGGYVPIARITEYDPAVAIIVNRPASELPPPLIHTQDKYHVYSHAYDTECGVVMDHVKCSDDLSKVTCPKCLAASKC